MKKQRHVCRRCMHELREDCPAQWGDIETDDRDNVIRCAYQHYTWPTMISMFAALVLCVVQVYDLPVTHQEAMNWWLWAGLTLGLAIFAAVWAARGADIQAAMKKALVFVALIPWWVWFVFIGQWQLDSRSREIRRERM